MSSRSPAATDLSFDREEINQTSRYREPTHSHTMPSSDANPSARIRQPRPALETGLRRTSAYAAKRDSTPSQDEDARLVMESVNASRKLNNLRSGAYDSYIDSYRDSYHYEDGKFETQPLRSQVGSPTYPDSSFARGKSSQAAQNNSKSPVELFDAPPTGGSSSTWRMGSTETTPRAKKLNMATPEDERPLFDVSPLPLAQRAPQASKAVNSNGQNKVMTPAQFEKYRKEQERQQRASEDSHSDGSDNESDNYDDED